MRQLYDPISIVLVATAVIGAASSAGIIGGGGGQKFDEVSSPAADRKAEEKARKEAIAEARRDRAGATGSRKSLLSPSTPASEIESRKTTLGAGVQ